MSIFEWDSCQLSYDGIQFNENHEDYNIVFNREGGSTATRKITCAWGDALPLATALRGNTVEVGGEVVYTDAASHPVLTELRVASVDIQPIGAPITTGTWEQAFLTIQYDTPEFGSGSDPEPLAEESIDITAFNQTETRQMIQFAGGDPVDEDVTFTVRTIEYTKTLFKQPRLPLFEIASLTNKVNDSTWNGFGPGEALYAGAQASREIGPGGDEWTITHTVLVDGNDYNTRYNPKTGQRERITYKGGLDNFYESGSFASVGLK